MNTFDSLQFLFFIAVLITLTPPLGAYMAKVFQGEHTFMHPVLGWMERLIYRMAGAPENEMTWKQYAVSLMGFNFLGIMILFLIQMLQGFLPLNPQGLSAPSWHSALNTAVSFVTNTNWQGYSGEITMSYFTQMLALAVQNFVSAAVGIAVAVALIRGISRRSSKSIGNYWVDMTRAIVYVLLPLSLLGAFFLVSDGVVQTLNSYAEAVTLEGAKQILPLGPAASQVSIKMLGTNGGGFFNANAAHPFENPTALSNFIQMLMIFLIPAALTYTFGSMTKARRHGWVVFGVMLALFVSLTSLSLFSEYHRNLALGIQGPSMEGKETRFGVFNSVLFSSITTAASCGAVNMMHSSLTPLSGGISMLNMMLGEIVFGGVGAGLYGMLLFILLTVFIAGLMVGRTPEYLGKKIEAREIQMVILAILAPCAMILLGTALATLTPSALSSLAHKGPHGFSEILYAFTSAAANNGSAFAGLNANVPFYNLALSIAMLVGRFAIILPLLAVAGSLAAKKYSPASSGTFEVDTPLFGVLLTGIILIIGALTFLPALALGPIVEHFLMMQGLTF
ncbi:ATPase [Bdellovibrio bacteriovorus]|uniref:Potassium-transporting ATPase potassium-binding subunit n=1 Tax=Bdellovibrio bacteriovorus TaxID=959 RepID=A0A150WK11_BDEBC|nr:potassium-transporting ATPase subunit KdpA [Bdellovibrio bacteriovorus]KYG64024.1 ATPase [Bdellovibrio bacteriovorus]